MKRTVLIVAAAAALAACTEDPQTLRSGVRQDTAAFQGTGLPYAVPGWKQGDRPSWEQHLKVRTQNGQNDYAKIQ